MAGENRRLVRLTVVLFALLLLQNVAGMYVNLYVTLPGGFTPFPWIFQSTPSLAFHLVNGFLLFGLAITVLVFARRGRDPRLVRPAVGGLAMIIVAGYAGGSFTFYRQDDVLSFLMEIAFLLAIASYASLLYLSSQGTQGSERASAGATGS